ncbi:unnamed protein product [Meloidogyne enterolobii]|uniref:Uncharacterized protein n=1 Tax=Meloidogyne enterolobii TaxID=390850 RepID=A0ACB0ZKX3_MELEN
MEFPGYPFGLGLDGRLPRKLGNFCPNGASLMWEVKQKLDAFHQTPTEYNLIP